MKIVNKPIVSQHTLQSSDAQRSSVWRSVAKASAERPDFAERERALERLTPER
jgi:hypothetical protein